MHTREGVADNFLRDMREVVAEIMKDPKADAGGSVSGIPVIQKPPIINVSFLKAAIYGMAQSIPDRSMVSDIASVFLETIYKV